MSSWRILYIIRSKDKWLPSNGTLKSACLSLRPEVWSSSTDITQ